MQRIVFLIIFSLALSPIEVSAQTFTDATISSGITHSHSTLGAPADESLTIATGAAASDIDNDGDIDLFMVGGSNNNSALYRNDGNGRFTEIGATAGLRIFNVHNSGPVFADMNNDGWQDLLLLSVNRRAGQPGVGFNDLINIPRVFLNNGDGSFSEKLDTGFDSGLQTFSAALADLDNDQDLDIFMTHWNSNAGGYRFLWLNDGNAGFTNITQQAFDGQLNNDGCGGPDNRNQDCFSYTPNITDINNDGWLDVLLTGDFGTSRILISNGINEQGLLTFDIERPAVLTDENGMGAAVADYDNDGDLDWFIASIWDPNGIPEGNWGISGSRLYRNIGDGVFEDATDEAGVGIGYWGWGSCFADFNNDGWLDLYHENGFTTIINNQAEEFEEDPARLFMSNGDGTFNQLAEQVGLDNTSQGRGVVCFDYDQDGDLDILVMPNNDQVRLYRNDLESDSHYFQIELQHPNPVLNIGAQIQLQTASGSQMREVATGSNFVSNNPLLQHFGLATQTNVEQLQINWRDGTSSTFAGLLPADKTYNATPICLTSGAQFSQDIEASSEVFLIDNSSVPLAGITISLQVSSGPNQGLQATAVTDINGKASFILADNGTGTDTLNYSFEIGGLLQQCQARVLRPTSEIIFRNGFD